MGVHGACIVKDFFTTSTAYDKGPLFTCDKRQATYIMKERTPRAEVFNGVIKKTKSAVYKTHLTGTVTKKLRKNGPRQQLLHCKANHNAMEEYHPQMDLLLESIFKDEDYQKRKPNNWLKRMQNVIGGNTYQHAHADQGRHMEYKEQKTFPFVAIHGFGQFAFQLWMLPSSGGKNKHGFLHTFSPTSLVLMRGDFIHAGGVSQAPRCHMEFYPKQKAGLVNGHAYHYWLEEDFDCTIDEPKPHGQHGKVPSEPLFLWHGVTFPFAYPLAHYEPNKNGQMRTVLTYPPQITADLVSVRKTAERELTWLSVCTQQF